MDRDAIAHCGMNCALCHSYQDPKRPCPGCRSTAVASIRKSCRNCAIAHCPQQTGYCSSCADFPCKQLRTLDARYRSRYHMSMLENLTAIRDKGEEAFLRDQAARYACPHCGGVLSVHYDHCLHCKEQHAP